MKDSQIDKILSSNDRENLEFYLTNLINKSNEISKENNRLGIIIIGLIFLFHIIDGSKAQSISIGPIVISDLFYIRTFIPLVLAFVLLRYKVINSHKAEIIRIVKKFSEHYFNYDDINNEPEFTDDFTRTLLPISLYEEFNKLNSKGSSGIGCLGAILIVPLSIVLTLVPYAFEYLWIKGLITDFYSLDFFEKSAVVLTLWILALSIYYLAHTMALTIKENKV